MVRISLPILTVLLLGSAVLAAKDATKTGGKDSAKNAGKEVCAQTEKDLEKQVQTVKDLEKQLAAANKQEQTVKDLEKQLAAANKQVQTVKELEKQLAAANGENAALKQQLVDGAQQQQQQVPFVSTEAIVDSFGNIVDFTTGYMPSADATKLSELASGFYDMGLKATPVVSQGLSAATTAIYSAADMAKDLHGKHLSEHTDEYYKTTMDAYNFHAEPHVSVARKAYYDNVHSHVGKASDTIYAGVGAAVEGGKSITPKFWEVVQMARGLSEGMSKGSAGPLAKQLAFLVEPKTFTVLGRKLDFNHGWLDIALAAVQALVVCYFGFHILWKFCLKTFVWNIGIKLLGKKVFLGLTTRVVKVSYKLTRFVISIALYLVFTIIAIAFSWVMIAICGGLGVALLHAIEKNAKVGLTSGMRLSIGLASGLLFYLICRCTCCKKRKALNGKKGSSAGKGAPAKTDSKKLAAPAKATNGKKK